MPSTSIAAETNTLTAPQDLSKLFAPFFLQDGTPSDARMNMAEVLKSAKQLIVTGGTITTNVPVIQSTQTWDAVGTVFTGFLHDFTIASAGANADPQSLVFHYRVNGSSYLKLTRYGDLQGSAFTGSDFSVRLQNGTLKLAQTSTIVWTTSASAADNTVDIGLVRNAAGVLRVTDGSSGTGNLLAKNVTAGTFTITDSNSVDLSPSNGKYQTWVLGANRTPILPTNFAAGQSMWLFIDDGSAFTISFASVAPVWIGTPLSSLPTTGFAVVELFKLGSTIYAKYHGNT